MIVAYCDESGIHQGAPICVVVGFVGSAKQWQLVEERWQKAARGVDFHGKRFFARTNGQRVKPYSGWTNEQAEAYLIRLLEVITSSRLTPIGAVIDVTVWKTLSLNERKFLTGAPFIRDKFITSGAPSKPYFLGFTHCINAAVLCVRKPGWKVSLVFDRQNEFAGYATKYYQLTLEMALPEIRERLGELSFKDKAGVGGLQAADLLAHACYRRTGLRIGRNPELDMATQRLAPMTRRKILLYDQATIAEHLSEVPERIRQAWQNG